MINIFVGSDAEKLAIQEILNVSFFGLPAWIIADQEGIQQ